MEERPVYARRDLVRIAKRLAKGARAATFEGAARAEAMVGGETPIAVAVAVIRSVLARMGHDLSGVGLWSDDHVWMERQALVEDTGLRDLAANIEEIIVAGCAAKAAPGASVDVRAPGSATRVTWATELEEVREFGAVESDEGAGGPADCGVEEDDDEEFFDCVALLPAPDAETLAAIASLRAVVRPGEPGQCDVPALEQARRELKAAIRRAAAEHEQKQENLLAQLKLRYAVAMAAAASVPLASAGATGLPTATAGAAGLPAATAGAAGLPLTAAGAVGQPLAAVGAAGQ
eukprot:COSAG01_NODE_14992_length_1387_cov_2.156056_1_plen_290_part_10